MSHLKNCSCGHGPIVHGFNRANGDMLATPAECLQPGCNCQRFAEGPAVEEITGGTDAEDALQEAILLLDQAVQFENNQSLLAGRIQTFVNNHRRKA